MTHQSPSMTGTFFLFGSAAFPVNPETINSKNKIASDFELLIISASYAFYPNYRNR